MRLYTYVCSSHKNEACGTNAAKTIYASSFGWCLANNDDEATGIAMRLGETALPVAEGWSAHSPKASLVPLDAMKRDERLENP